MKPVSVIEVYTTKISHSLFLLKFEENLMSIEKPCYSDSQNSLRWQLLFEVYLFKFHLVSALQYLDCYCNKYQREANNLLIL